jgi:hypothetical protein
MKVKKPFYKKSIYSTHLLLIRNFLKKGNGKPIINPTSDHANEWIIPRENDSTMLFQPPNAITYLEEFLSQTAKK